MKSRLRKHRRVVSLLMAIVMVFAFMSMTASAATVEVQPRGTCPSCTYGYMEEGSVTCTEKKVGSWSSSCPNIGAGHQHYDHVFYYTTICRNCGYTCYYSYAYTLEYCPYNGYV